MRESEKRIENNTLEYAHEEEYFPVELVVRTIEKKKKQRSKSDQRV